MINLLDSILDKMDGLEIKYPLRKTWKICRRERKDFMKKSLVGEKGKIFWEKPRQIDKKKIHKSGMPLMETISWKRVLNTHYRDQQEEVDPCQEL